MLRRLTLCLAASLLLGATSLPGVQSAVAEEACGDGNCDQYCHNYCWEKMTENCYGDIDYCAGYYYGCMDSCTNW